MNISKFSLENVRAFIHDPANRELVQRAGKEILNLKALGSSSVHNDGTLSNFSVAYKNESFIGLQLMPPCPSPVGGKYFIHDRTNVTAVPDTAIANARGAVNEIDMTYSTGTIACAQYALEGYVDAHTLEAADMPLDLMLDLGMQVNDYMDLAEEIRIATILLSTSSITQNTTLSGANQWDSGSGGDPVKDIQTAVRACWQGPGSTELVMYSGYSVFMQLSRHQAILDLFKNVASGLATSDMIAKYFGCSRYLVGGARKETAVLGQTQAYGDVWGDGFGVARVAKNPTPRTAGLGFTFREMGGKVTTQWFDPRAGMAGGYRLKVGVSEQHAVTSVASAYLIADCMSSV